MKLEFYREIFQKIKYKISWKSIQWEAGCSLRRQTDMTNPKIAFQNFMNAANNNINNITIFKVKIN